MSLSPQQRSLLALLQERQSAGLSISADEICEVTGWKPATVRTYISKKLWPFLNEISSGKFLINGLESVSEAAFQQLMTQSDRVKASLDLSPLLQETIRSQNPWWSGLTDRQLPEMRRWIFSKLLKSLKNGLAPVTVLRGPRRVGKTTLLRQVIDSLLKEEVEPRSILYVQFDSLPGLLEPGVVVLIARFFQEFVLESDFNQREQPAYLIFDEVQNLEHWAGQIKYLADTFNVRVLITGSSSLSIQAEIEQLAGRISTLDIGPLLPREIHALVSKSEIEPYWRDNGQRQVMSREFWDGALQYCRQREEEVASAFRLFTERGGYPTAYSREPFEWQEFSDWLQDNVVQKALREDLVRIGWRSREEAERLFEVLRLVCRYAGQSPNLSTLERELKSFLGESIKQNQVLDALEFLEAARLIRRIRPMEARARKNKASTKLCLCDLSLRAAWLQESVSLLESYDPVVGWLAESVVGYHIGSVPNLDICTYPARSEREPEVDFVLTVGTSRLPVEVKYQKTISRDHLSGLRSFLRKFPDSPFGLLITREDFESPEENIIAMPLRYLLWLR